MNIKWVIIFLVILLNENTFAGGVVIQNGGDIVRCSGKSNYDSLDYILTRRIFGPQTKILQQTSLQNYLSHISALLGEKLPQLQVSFDFFIQNLGRESNSGLYSWRPLPDGMALLQEATKIYLPIYCSNSAGRPDIDQAIMREKIISNSQTKINFYYDSNIFEMFRGHPVNLSFLFVHEWLWNIVDTDEQNRKMNYFLHSDLFNRLSAAESVAELKKLGISSLIDREAL